jgi:hypothetical protein
VLLIDEIVLPERHATAQGVQHDIEVLTIVDTYTEPRSKEDNFQAFRTRFRSSILTVL